MTQDQLEAKLLKQINELVRVPYPLATHTLKQTRKFSGETRINTRMAVGSPDTSVVRAREYKRNAFKDTISTKRKEFADFIESVKAGDKIFVTNALPHSIFVEYKHGDLMFEKAVQLFPYLAGKVINEYS